MKDGSPLFPRKGSAWKECLLRGFWFGVSERGALGYMCEIETHRLATLSL